MGAKQKRGLKNILCAGIVGLALAGCAKEARAAPVNSNSIIKDGIEYYMQTDKSVYNLGETVQMLYRVKNLGDEIVTFRFRVGPVTDRVDYIVDKDGERIWDNIIRPSTDAVTSFILSSSASRSFTQSWDMTDLSGNQILPGNYDVTGALSDLRLGYEDKHVPVSVSIEIIPEPVTIEAGVDITPNTLNLQSKAKWLTCYIWLPEDYNIADIEPNSVLLEDEIQPEWIWFDEEEQVVMAKFNRSEVQDILSVGDEVELTVTGQLIDGTMFVGTDTIRVIDKGRGRR